VRALKVLKKALMYLKYLISLTVCTLAIAPFGRGSIYPDSPILLGNDEAIVNNLSNDLDIKIAIQNSGGRENRRIVRITVVNGLDEDITLTGDELFFSLDEKAFGHTASGDGSDLLGIFNFADIRGRSKSNNQGIAVASRATLDLELPLDAICWINQASSSIPMEGSKCRTLPATKLFLSLSIAPFHSKKVYLPLYDSKTNGSKPFLPQIGSLLDRNLISKVTRS
jgi:hypothetical protein